MSSATTHKLGGIRRDLGITQRDMADLLGCSVSTLHRLERCEGGIAKTRFAPLVNALSVHYWASKDKIRARLAAGEGLWNAVVKEVAP